MIKKSSLKNLKICRRQGKFLFVCIFPTISGCWPLFFNVAHLLICEGMSRFCRIKEAFYQLSKLSTCQLSCFLDCDFYPTKTDRGRSTNYFLHDLWRDPFPSISMLFSLSFFAVTQGRSRNRDSRARARRLNSGTPGKTSERARPSAHILQTNEV